ncbi:MAG: tetratricopeptide repeat protein [Nitrospirae bacterium]|nr:tetratricopeptide repeat protein [Nitrospirota bacterium]
MDVNEKSKGGLAALQESAQHFTLKGDYDKAISAWKSILAIREDANSYNTLGDLYLKKGLQTEAIEVFTLAAGRFKTDGFHQKAVAIYKKILNIIPSDVGALVALADLYAEKDFAGNAATYYIKAAEKLSRDGNPDKAIDIYNKILRLTPSDISIRTRIADLWLSRGLPEKAANDYAAIAGHYLERDELDVSVEFFSKALGIDPQNVASFIGLSKLAERQNNLEQALEFEQKALNYSQNDNDILSRYVQLAVRAGKADDAGNTLSGLILAAPADIFLKKMLGNVYISEGQPEKAWEILLPCIDDLLQDQNWDDAYELLDQFRESFPVPVRQRLITFYRGKADNESLERELNDLAMLFEGQEAHRNALGLYRELAELRPDDIAIAGKIEELETLLGLKPVESPGVINIQDKLDSLMSALETGPPTFEAPAAEEAVQSTDNSPAEEIQYTDIDEEDYEARYNSGIEYRQKGLLDDAIREFRVVAKDPGKALLCSRMIAMCYMEKGAFVHAIGELNTLLESMSGSDERRHDIEYELAGAHMQNNDYGKALEIYSGIRAWDRDYRDVSHKLEVLRDLMMKSEGTQKTRKNRISYI